MALKAPLPQHKFWVYFSPPDKGPEVGLGFVRVSEIKPSFRSDEYKEVTSPQVLTSPTALVFAPVTFSRGVCAEEDYMRLNEWYCAPVNGQPFVGRVSIYSIGYVPSGTVEPSRFTARLDGWISDLSYGGWDAMASGALLSSLTFSPWSGEFSNE